MKILLSAYACEPNKGSEPGVGWNWALALVRRGHEVWVITRANNQSSIDQALASLGEPYTSKLHFLYYDLPSWATWWKKGRRGVHLYYLLWQWGAYQLAKKVHKGHVFDLVHHSTFVSVRQPSFMGNLRIPFIFGPVAGGESIPKQMRKELSWQNKLKELARDLANKLVQFDPMMLRTFSQASRIYVTSFESLSLIPNKYKHKTRVQLAIAIDETVTNEEVQHNQNNQIFRVLYIGHFIYLKGMHLGLAAFALFLNKYPNAQLTMVGHGAEGDSWKDLANQLGINQAQLIWQSWLPQNELGTLYQSHDVFFFPSLRDSGGMVVLEAMANGLPVVCLKLGGPGVLVDSSCGEAIDVKGLSQQVVIMQLADALIRLADNPDLMRCLRKGAKSRSAASSWDANVEKIYAAFENLSDK